VVASPTKYVRGTAPNVPRRRGMRCGKGLRQRK